MKRVLESSEPIPFLDARGQDLLLEARRCYVDASLSKKQIFQQGASTLVATWRGDLLNDALVLLLRANRLDATNNGVVVSVSNGSHQRVVDTLDDIAKLTLEDATEVVAGVENLDREKWDWALPASVKRTAFASTHLDLEGALSLARHTTRS